MFSYKPFNNHIGLDISDFKIRFVQTHSHRRSRQINALGEINVPEGLIVSGEIRDEKEVANLIKKMIAKPLLGKVDTKFVNAALPEKKLFIKVVEVPNVPENELAGAIRWGVEQNVPVDVEDVNFDWQPTTLGTTNQDKLKFIVSVAEKDIVNSYTQVLKAADMIPINMENESTAIARCLVAKKDIMKPVLIIDLGRSRTNVLISYKGQMVYSSSVEVSGHEMTEAVSQKLDMSFADAEKAKIICGLDKRKSRGRIKELLEPILLRLVQRVEDHRSFYSTYISSKAPLKDTILTGSVSSMFGLPTFLEKQLNLDVIIGQPYTNVITPKKSLIPMSINEHSFTTAIGLSLVDFE